jgi:N-acyl-D-amino-acid deacylase
MPGAFDLIVRGGEVLDGTGAPAAAVDIGIRGDRIAAVGDLAGADAGRVLDAAGAAVAPGFIDAHTHSDPNLPIEPDAPSKIAQGVTTEICGQCGSSAAPLPAENAGSSGPTWNTVAEYRELLRQVRPAVNVVLFIGHNTLRKAVMGYAPRPATEDEVAAMARRLEQALDEGGSGLSTGLIYQPGKYAAPGEIRALARQTGIHVQISHLKTSGPANWDKLDAAIGRIEAARAAGLRVHADRYPYLAGGTDLDVVLPEWASAGGREAILRNLADPAARQRVIAELDAADRDWSTVMIGGARHPEVRALTGRTVAEAAAALGLSPGAALAWLIATDEARTDAFFFGLCERNLLRIYAQPWVMVGSDASLRAPTGPLADSHPHPRAYGAFARFLRLMQDQGLLTLPEAVRRCTSLPADAFGLTGRGRVRVGDFADLVVFDPRTIRDRATYAQPHQFAEGVRQVIVNGRLAWDGGRCTGDRHGAWLQAAPA